MTNGYTYRMVTTNVGTLWEVGFYTQDQRWNPDSLVDTEAVAQERVHALNELILQETGDDEGEEDARGET